MSPKKVINVIHDVQLVAWREALAHAELRLERQYGVEDPSSGRVLRELCEAYVGVDPSYWEDDAGVYESVRCYDCGRRYVPGREAPGDHASGCSVRQTKEQTGFYDHE